MYVVFTPSATLAANEIILGLEWDSLKNVYLTPFEHNAIARPLHKVCQENGLKEKFIAFDPQIFVTCSGIHLFLFHKQQNREFHSNRI